MLWWQAIYVMVASYLVVTNTDGTRSDPRTKFNEALTTKNYYYEY